MFKKIMMSLVLAALAAGVGWADIPAQINFQGRLTDASGAPLTAATTLSFQIFDVVSGGTPLWTGTTNVGAVAPDKNGVFNLIIGQDTSNGSTLGQLPFDKPYWVEVLVGSPAVSLGRQPLTATPYAITAKNVYGGTGYFSGGVGIGTTSPSAKLHLVADTAYSDWSGSAHGLRVASGLTTNATSLLMGADESQSLAFLMSVHPATPKNPMGKLALNPLGGNVGISTAAPAYTLDVQGDINFNGRLLQGGEEVSLGGSKWGSSGSDIYYTGGKVGIGTASPAAKLNIDPKGAGGILIGNSAVTGNYTSLVLGISANESGFSSIQSIQRANGSVPGNLLLNPSGGSVGIGMNNTSVTTMLDVAGDIWARGTIRAESFLDNFGNKIGEGVWKTNGSNIYNSNSGNVGIGTANVVAKLDLGGSLAMNDNGLLLRGGSDASHMLRFYSSYAGLSNYDTFTYDNGFAFLRGAAPKLVLNSSGNVGIGTTSPKAKLAINSQVYNAPLGKNYEQYSLLLFDGGAAASSYGLGIEDFHVGFHSNGGYKFYKQGREMPLLLIGDNIGVGTTSPSAKLHLVA
ncbi:MAG: hypothetical protein JW873_01335, partial [Candidatus Saganbacteria bacterium]|nr:hypothetical protein [Candidatus Saganbacteria bacterium]